jgi:hypothetical protein
MEFEQLGAFLVSHPLCIGVPTLTVGAPKLRVDAIGWTVMTMGLTYAARDTARAHPGTLSAVSGLSRSHRAPAPTFINIRRLKLAGAGGKLRRLLQD